MIRFALVLTSLFFVSSLASAEGAKLIWLGHAAFIYKSKSGTTLLIDPWIKNPKAPQNFKLGQVNGVLVSHGHGDHVGQAFELSKENNAPLVASHELTEIAKTKGVKNVAPLNPSGTTTIGSVTITAVEAVHSSGYDDHGKTIYAGAPMGFILEEKGSPTVYHAGDTGIFSSMALIKDLYHPSVVLLPIGGIYTMKPKEAAKAIHMLDAKGVVPMHFGTFPALAGNPEELKTELGSEGSKVHVLEPGVEVSVSSLQ